MSEQGKKASKAGYQVLAKTPRLLTRQIGCKDFKEATTWILKLGVHKVEAIRHFNSEKIDGDTMLEFWKAVDKMHRKQSDQKAKGTG
jgi:hypothetical protein